MLKVGGRSSKMVFFGRTSSRSSAHFNHHHVLLSTYSSSSLPPPASTTPSATISSTLQLYCHPFFYSSSCSSGRSDSFLLPIFPRHHSPLLARRCGSLQASNAN